MKEYRDVIGSKESSKPIVIGKDTVYIHSNVREEEFDDPLGNKIIMYKYDEIQYDKDEYLEKLIIENNDLHEKTKVNAETLETLLTEMIPTIIPTE